MVATPPTSAMLPVVATRATTATSPVVTGEESCLVASMFFPFFFLLICFFWLLRNYAPHPEYVPELTLLRLNECLIDEEQPIRIVNVTLQTQQKQVNDIVVLSPKYVASNITKTQHDIEIINICI